jgi:hypothetical protein
MEVVTIDNMYEDAGRDLLVNLLASLPTRPGPPCGLVAIVPEYADTPYRNQSFRFERVHVVIVADGQQLFAGIDGKLFDVTKEWLSEEKAKRGSRPTPTVPHVKENQ